VLLFIEKLNNDAFQWKRTFQNMTRGYLIGWTVTICVGSEPFNQ